MNKYTFIQEDQDGNKVIHEFSELTLPGLLEHFEYFLKGCTFHFNGTIEIVKDEE